MVDKVEAPDPSTVVFHLKFATDAFLPALADPFTFIYKKEILDQGSALVREEYPGLGPVQIRRIRHRPGDQRGAQPRLLSQGVALSRRLHRHLCAEAGGPGRGDPQRPRCDRVPRSSAFDADELVKALDGQLNVQESDWNCGNLVTPNHQKKPFDDPRVRRALTLAIDRWHGAPALSKIANVRTVGGIVFPGSPLAATKEELRADRRVLARYRKIAGGGEAAIEGGRSRRAQLRAVEPGCRPAVQICRHLARRRVEQDRAQRDAARAARPVRNWTRCAAAISRLP